MFTDVVALRPRANQVHLNPWVEVDALSALVVDHPLDVDVVVEALN